MIIKPKVRGFICTNAHPQGCAVNVQEQIAFTKAKGPVANAPKKVLVLGCSTGFGLSSRITAAFGGGADTLGVCFEKSQAMPKPARLDITTPLRSTMQPKQKACTRTPLTVMPSLMH